MAAKLPGCPASRGDRLAIPLIFLKHLSEIFLAELSAYLCHS
jgi:hypothetical protein